MIAPTLLLLATTAIVQGDGIRLEPGLFAFVDGNAMGGIGVVLVEQREAEPAATASADSVTRAVAPSTMPMTISCTISTPSELIEFRST